MATKREFSILTSSMKISMQPSLTLSNSRTLVTTHTRSFNIHFGCKMCAFYTAKETFNLPVSAVQEW